MKNFYICKLHLVYFLDFVCDLNFQCMLAFSSGILNDFDIIISPWVLVIRVFIWVEITLYILREILAILEK